MRCNLALPQSLDKLLLLIQLVRAQRDWFRPRCGAGPSHLVQHDQRRLPLRRRTRLRGTGRHHQPMTVLDDHVPQVSACGSVVDSWVSRKHFLPRAPVPWVGGGSLGSKLPRFAQASNSVPSTVKCSSLSKLCARACSTTATSKRCDTSPCSKRSRFLV